MYSRTWWTRFVWYIWVPHFSSGWYCITLVKMIKSVVKTFKWMITSLHLCDFIIHRPSQHKQVMNQEQTVSSYSTTGGIKVKNITLSVFVIWFQWQSAPSLEVQVERKIMNLFMYTFAAILGFSSLVMGHMSLQYPLQFKTPWNPQRDAIDPDHRDPIIRNSLPCKSTHEGMTSESSVVTWAAGSTQRVVVTGSAVRELTFIHPYAEVILALIWLDDGGSCQLSLNYDQGKTFRVIHSMVRGCPHNDAFGYDFQLPGDTAPDLAIFSWSCKYSGILHRNLCWLLK